MVLIPEIWTHIHSCPLNPHLSWALEGCGHVSIGLGCAVASASFCPCHWPGQLVCVRPPPRKLKCPWKGGRPLRQGSPEASPLGSPVLLAHSQDRAHLPGQLKHSKVDCGNWEHQSGGGCHQGTGGLLKRERANREGSPRRIWVRLCPCPLHSPQPQEGWRGALRVCQGACQAEARSV